MSKAEMQYKQIGVANWGNPDRMGFLTPVFESRGRYYVQTIGPNYEVRDFKEVNKPGDDFLNTSLEMYIKKGDHAIFHFRADTRKIVGTKNEIEEDLLRLLASETDIHLKFLIANFLNLFRTQIELLADVNRDLEEIGVEGLNEELPFLNKVSGQNIQTLSPEFKKRFETLKRIADNIRESDVGFVKGSYFFFGNSKYLLQTLKAYSTDETLYDLIPKICEQVIDVKPDDTLHEQQIAYEFRLSSSHYFGKDESLVGLAMNAERNFGERPIKKIRKRMLKKIEVDVSLSMDELIGQFQKKIYANQ